MIGKIEDIKVIDTRDLNGASNGSIIELYKEAGKTIAYITTVKPKAFKGYHLHKVRKGQYVCIKGRVRISLFKPGTKDYQAYILDSKKPQRLFIPVNVAAGLLNIGKEEAWVINYTDPPYDPNLKDEQIEYTEEELKKGVIK